MGLLDRSPCLALFVTLSMACDQGAIDDPPASEEGAICAACTDPDSASCARCQESEQLVFPQDSPYQDPSIADVVPVTASTLDFAIVGDTRPPSIDDTKAYPSAIITKIWQDIESESPRPPFTVATGDYQFSRPSGAQAGPQLDLYLTARRHYSGLDFPAMGNHECTGATASNCGPGTSNGSTTTYNTYLSKLLTPIGVHNPYYMVWVTNFQRTWSAKIVFVAANAWTATQSSWLDGVLARSSTYTFIVRHESSGATTAPGVTPSDQIIAKHPHTMLIAGHTHTYKRYASRQIIVGNGGAPLTTGSSYGYGVVRQRADGNIVFTFYQYDNHRVMDTFVVKPDGTITS